MTSLNIQQLDFEAALYAAFSIEPVPKPELTRRTIFVQTVREKLWGKQWPYVIGKRLTFGELDPPLTIWFQALPSVVADYYLPSHLMLSSLLLPGYSQPTYISDVVEALILPPSCDVSEMEDIDDELCLAMGLIDYGSVRRALYERLTCEQRQCIAMFLDLYLASRSADFTANGLGYFKRNAEFWRTSSLPPT